MAERAEVSVMTVSRAIHRPDSVSRRTLSRVQDAIAGVGYVPSLVGRGLVTGRTRLIGAVVPSIGNPVFAEILQGVSERLRADGFHLLLGTSEASPGTEETLIGTLLAQRAEGVIIHGLIHTSAARALLRKAGLPVVETGSVDGAPLDMAVGISNRAAARAMTEHLIARGYCRIGLVNARARWNDRARDRARGYREALAAHGLPFRTEAVLETSLGLRQGAEALIALLDRVPDLDAVFLAADHLAAGAALECQRRGWDVPGRVAIAGFDDQPIAAELNPALTTIRVDRAEIGRRAAGLLLDHLAGRCPPRRREDVGFTLIPRATT